tara:strand:+ start:4475 stop:4873 length:399 start_codon:yes stop_codon:yes gene_type:complete
MDLKDLTPSLNDLVVEIKHPATGDVLKNDDGTSMTITILAPHSKEYKKAQNEQINKRLKKAQKSKSQEVDYSDIEEATLEVLSKTTKSWDITYGGEKPKLTAARAKDLYEEVFWIRSQLEEVVTDAMDFTKI